MISVNVTIIYGTMRKANTYNCVQLLLNNLRLSININVTEFFLSKDLISFCDNFLSTPTSSQDTFINFDYTDYITDSLDESDLIILACPVLACDISTDMKLLLNHLYYKSIRNNTRSFMNNKIGLIISTAAGAGLFNSTRTLKRNLSFWGIPNIFVFSKTFYEVNWDYVTLKTRLQLNKQIFKISNKILYLYITLRNSNAYILRKITPTKMKHIINTNNCNIIDFNYQKKQVCLHDTNIGSP
jgi:multimeric flavodoxin WrbA